MTESRKRQYYKWISYTSLILALLLLQTTILSRLSVFSTTPSLIPFVVGAIAMLEGSESGAATGLVGGFLSDVIYAGHEGFYTVVYTLLAVLVCLLDQFMFWKNYAVSVINWLFISILTNVVFYVLFTVGGGRGDASALLYVILGELLTSVVFTPFLYALIARISKSFKNEEEL